MEGVGGWDWAYACKMGCSGGKTAVLIRGSVKMSELVFISKGKVRSGRLAYILLLLEIPTYLRLHLIDLA
jgi:hypothetical protein